MLAEHGKLVAGAREEAQRQSEATIAAQQELGTRIVDLSSLKSECGEWYHVLSQVETVTESTRKRQGGNRRRVEEKRRILVERQETLAQSRSRLAQSRLEAESLSCHRDQLRAEVQRLRQQKTLADELACHRSSIPPPPPRSVEEARISFDRVSQEGAALEKERHERHLALDAMRQACEAEVSDARNARDAARHSFRELQATRAARSAERQQDRWGVPIT